jgi:hypothetical protein
MDKKIPQKLLNKVDELIAAGGGYVPIPSSMMSRCGILRHINDRLENNIKEFYIFYMVKHIVPESELGYTLEVLSFRVNMDEYILN